MSLPDDLLPDDFVEPEEEIPPRPRLRRARWLRELLETILIFAIVYVLVNLLTARFIVDGSSMAPNLATGEYVIVNRVAYLLDNPQRGDVVVVQSPDEQDIDLIKRLIGLPGETIEISAGLVHVNGTALNEPYLNAQPRYQGTWTLGENEYFVLGDNRNNSRDSHNFGPLPGASLIGQAAAIYWPPEAWKIIAHFDYSDPELEPLPTLVPTETPIPVQ